MKITEENKVVSLFPEEQPKQDQNWVKSIPAQVFLNYFFAISYHIGQADAGDGLRHVPYFYQHQPVLNEQDLEAVKKLLLTSWSTEYALRATAELGDEHYLRHALHWTFPQAYYAVFAGLQAFLYTMGVKSNNPDVLLREAGRLVVKNTYPRAIGFYASGHYSDFNIHRLPLAHYKPSLHIADKELEAQAQIGQFLRTTRKMRAKAIRQLVQANTSTAIRSNRTGKVLEKFGPQHWQQITWRVGYTTIFDLLTRLQISSNHKEIDRYVEAEIDFKLFHESLLEIVSYLNGVHESYVAKAIGAEAYVTLLKELPQHLQQSFAESRWVQQIEPLFGRNDSEVKLAA
ncbi:MAG: hypothetical protein LPK19_01570 [Hymenobacteraceae bacterium]|nr:hypothetical protein [Hymenobacteraceae bacterium]MDX5394862.1 hypothetical protein [Hymenobacteraceae bacterium]MDX5510897.1 hypothetical protein [Hymenobacteraceae bacterium]